MNTPWYKNPWIWLPLVALLMFGAGFGSGRYALPAKVVTQEKVQVVTTEKVVVQTKVETQVKVVYVKDKTVAVDKHETKVETKNPDGTVVTKTETDTKSKTDEKTNTQTDSKTSVGVVKTDDLSNKTTTVVTKTVTNQPSWVIRAGVGIGIPTFLGEKQLGVPGMKGFVVEAGVSRRVIGPFHIGLFGNTQGTVGLDLSGNF